MRKTVDRIKQRRQYLQKKALGYTGTSIMAVVTVPYVLATLCLLILPFFFPLDNWMEFLCLAVLLLYFGGVCWGCAWLTRMAYQTTKQLPYVPPVTADILPGEEVLLRGAEAPAQEQSKRLLRSADGRSGQEKQELLRAG